MDNLLPSPKWNCEIIQESDHADLIAFWETCPGLCVSTSDQFPHFARYLRRNPETNFLVKNQAGEIIGTALAGHDGRRGTLRHVAVRPDFQGRGIAKALVRKCLAALAQEGIERTYAIVLTDNKEGLEFWSHNGWEDLVECKLLAIGKPKCLENA